MVERFGRIEEARGSIPLTSTSSLASVQSGDRLPHRSAFRELCG